MSYCDFHQYYGKNNYTTVNLLQLLVSNLLQHYSNNLYSVVTHMEFPFQITDFITHMQAHLHTLTFDDWHLQKLLRDRKGQRANVLTRVSGEKH